MKPISRRALLRGAGGVAIGLPLLEAMMPAKAQAQGAVPKRVIFWFTANGTVRDTWKPTGGETDFDLVNHAIHAPLEPFRDKVIFLDGVDDKVANQSIGDGHQTGMACLLSNAEIQPGTLFCEGDCAAGMEVYVGWGGGQSIDQYIASEIEKDVILKYRSLELGVQVQNASIWSRMSYSEPGIALPHRADPNENFNAFFGDFESDPFQIALLKKKRRSVLDAVGRDYERLNERLGKEDRIKVAQHLDAIRAVELRLDAVTNFGEACEIPSVDLPGANYNQNDMYPVTGKAQMDLLAMALACDMTRVASIQWSTSVSNTRFTWLAEPVTEGHHDLSHFDDGDGYAVAALTRINRWYTEQFAYFLGVLDSIPEGDSTLLDNSVVVWVNELGKGNSHTRNGIPFVLAGGCQGYFATGRSLSYGGAPHGQLLVSLANAMDKPVATFGVPEHSDGTLPNLSA